MTSVFDGVGRAGFRSRVNASLLSRAALFLFIVHVFSFSSFSLWVGCCVVVVFRLIECIDPHPACNAEFFKSHFFSRGKQLVMSSTDHYF